MTPPDPAGADADNFRIEREAAYKTLRQVKQSFAYGKIGPPRQPVTEIKAVTFHGLQIEQAGGAWRAQVIFDL